LLNRVENYLISLSHTIDQNASEHTKQMRELKEQTEFIGQQLDRLKKKLFDNKNKSGGLKSNSSSISLSN
jgi:hypothetical protein